MEALFSNSHHQFLPYDTQLSHSKPNNIANNNNSNNSNNNNNNNNDSNPNVIIPNEKEIPKEDAIVGNPEGNKEDGTKEEKDKVSIKLRVAQLLRYWIMKYWDIFQEDNQLRRLMKTLVWMHIHYRMVVAADGSVDNEDDIVRDQRLMLAITRSIVESKVLPPSLSINQMNEAINESRSGYLPLSGSIRNFIRIS